MSQNVSKWLIQSGKIYLQAKIWIILPLHFLENLRKYISAIYWQKYKLHFQPFIKNFACCKEAFKEMHRLKDYVLDCKGQGRDTPFCLGSR